MSSTLGFMFLLLITVIIWPFGVCEAQWVPGEDIACDEDDGQTLDCLSFLPTVKPEDMPSCIRCECRRNRVNIVLSGECPLTIEERQQSNRTSRVEVGPPSALLSRGLLIEWPEDQAVLNFKTIMRLC